MVKEYLKIEPITERKLIQQLAETEGKIPYDRYVRLKQLIDVCIKKKQVHIAELEEMINLLTNDEKNNKMEIESESCSSNKKEKLKENQLHKTNLALLLYMHRCNLRKTLIRLYFLFNEPENGAVQAQQKF